MSEQLSEERVEVVEYTDPLCSIAWGTEPSKRKLHWRFGEKLRWRAVMAGLCRDNSSVEMFQPREAYKAGAAIPKSVETCNQYHGDALPRRSSLHGRNDRFAVPVG